MDAQAVLSKLKLPGGRIAVIDAPAEAEALVLALEGRIEPVGALDAAIVFATERAVVDALVPELATRLDGDAALWLCYPKKASKRYRADFGRDDPPESIGAAGFEPVRQIALDDDWSALRFRRVEHVRGFTRATARTAVGRARIQARDVDGPDA